MLPGLALGLHRRNSHVRRSSEVNVLTNHSSVCTRAEESCKTCLVHPSLPADLNARQHISATARRKAQELLHKADSSCKQHRPCCLLLYEHSPQRIRSLHGERASAEHLQCSMLSMFALLKCLLSIRGCFVKTFINTLIDIHIYIYPWLPCLSFPTSKLVLTCIRRQEIINMRRLFKSLLKPQENINP